MYSGIINYFFSDFERGLIYSPKKAVKKGATRFQGRFGEVSVSVVPPVSSYPFQQKIRGFFVNSEWSREDLEGI